MSCSFIFALKLSIIFLTHSNMFSVSFSPFFVILSLFNFSRWTMSIVPTFLLHSVSLVFITFVRIHFTYSRVNFRRKISIIEWHNLMNQSILKILKNKMKATNNIFIIWEKLRLTAFMLFLFNFWNHIFKYLFFANYLSNELVWVYQPEKSICKKTIYQLDTNWI